MGRTKRDTLGSTPFFSSKQAMVTGRVAALCEGILSIFHLNINQLQYIFIYLEEVPKAVARAWNVLMI